MSIPAEPGTVQPPENQSPKWSHTYMLCPASLALTAKFYVNVTCFTTATAATQKKVLDTINATVTQYCMGQHYVLFTH